MIAGRRLGALVDAHGMWHRDVMRASCRRTPEHPPSPAPPGHAAPDPACTCGINGYAERAEAIVTLALLGQWQPLATGQVELWGQVLGPGWDLPRRVREDRRLSDSRHPRRHRHLMMKRQG